MSSYCACNIAAIMQKERERIFEEQGENLLKGDDECMNEGTNDGACEGEWMENDSDFEVVLALMHAVNQSVESVVGAIAAPVDHAFGSLFGAVYLPIVASVGEVVSPAVAEVRAVITPVTDAATATWYHMVTEGDFTVPVKAEGFYEEGTHDFDERSSDAFFHEEVEKDVTLQQVADLSCGSNLTDKGLTILEEEDL